MYGWIFRHVLVRMDAERAHRIFFALLRALVRVPGVARLMRRRYGPSRPVQAMGMNFPGPLGLAAGFDKNAEGIDALAALGFGFVEVGTITAHPQPGNPRPRLFRLVRDRAIVNRMGFNNDGAVVVAESLARFRARSQVVVGVNIGKTKVVPAERAIDDYRESARLLAPHADYLVVNVSSPNTPGLRDLQAVEQLRPLLLAVRDQADEVCDRRVPLLVKISPDLSDDDVVAVADLASELSLDGIVATNTTIAREGLATPPSEAEAAGAGGLSGVPLRQRSLDVLELLRDRVGPDVTLISVGGISSPEDVGERLRRGATLVQAYTGLIYGGPLWPSRINRAIRREELSSG